MSTPEDAGSIYAELRLSLAQMEKDGLAADAALQKLALKFKTQGELGGKMYVQGVGKAQRDLNMRLNNMVSSLNGISPKMGKLGDAIAKGFSKPIFAMVPAVSTAFTMMLGAIGPVIALVGTLGAVAARVGKEKREAAKKIKEAYKELNTEIARTNMLIQAGQMTSAGKARAEAVAQEKILNALLEEAARLTKGLTEEQIKRYRSEGAAKDLVEKIEKETQILKIKKEQAARAESSEESSKRMRSLGLEISAGLEEEANRRKRILEIDEERLRSMIEAKVLMEDNSELTETLIEGYKKGIAEQKEQIRLDEIQNEILVTNEKYALAKANAEQQVTEKLINQEEANKRIAAAEAARYSDLDAIADKYKFTKEQTEALVGASAKLVKQEQDKVWLSSIQKKQEDELLKIEIEKLRLKASNADSEDERNIYLQKALDLENGLIKKQRELEREAIINSVSFKSQSEDVKNKILSDFDEITVGMAKIKQKSGDEGSNIFEQIVNSDWWDIGQESLNALSSVMDASLEIARSAAEERMALIDKELEHLLESLEKERKARLIANGFAVENSVESLEAQLEAAKKTGDEVLIYQTERRLLEQQINDEFDAKAKEAADAAAHEKAKIDYNLSKQKYANDMINAINHGIMAVLQALSSAPPPFNIALAAISGAATGAQITALSANPPKPPKFEHSGIVPGTSYSGDRVNALVNSGELILDRAKQDNIADQLTNGGVIRATFIIVMDKREQAKYTVDLLNDGIYEISERAIRKR